MVIHNYHYSWITDFELLKETLQKALKDIVVTVEHVGSTAVKDLAAKPIIDIDIVYEKHTSFTAVQTGLEKLGYYHNGDQGIKGREVFKRSTVQKKHRILDAIAHHLYVCRTDSEELWRHVTFRDYLRTHEKERKAYEHLKYTLAEKAGEDRKKYAKLKELMARDFVESVLKKAREKG